MNSVKSAAAITKAATPRVALSRDIYTLAPASPDTNNPQLIILFGWMDAQVKHLAKYEASYQLLVS